LLFDTGTGRETCPFVFWRSQSSGGPPTAFMQGAEKSR
jgi:hypothetical protein